MIPCLFVDGRTIQIYSLFNEEHMNLDNIGRYHRAYCRFVHKFIFKCS